MDEILRFLKENKEQFNNSTAVWRDVNGKYWDENDSQLYFESSSILQELENMIDSHITDKRILIEIDFMFTTLTRFVEVDTYAF